MLLDLLIPYPVRTHVFTDAKSASVDLICDRSRSTSMTLDVDSQN